MPIGIGEQVQLPVAASASTGGGSITNQYGQLSSPVSLTTGSPGVTPLFTTPSLATGTWLLSVTVLVKYGSGYTNNVALEVRNGQGTATSTTPGGAGYASAPQAGLEATSNQVVTVSLTCILVVTVAGTVIIQGYNYDSVAAATAEAVDPVSGDSNASGWTAIKIQ
jgi:hypothetical protein